MIWGVDADKLRNYFHVMNYTKTVSSFLLFTVISALTPALLAKEALRDSPLKHVTDADDVLEVLMQGNQRFVSGAAEASGRDAERLMATSNAQRPLAIVLSCADSRVAPEILFDQGVGDLFVVRVAGNTLTPDGLASIEYAVAVLETPLLFVLGHEGCGAVDAAIKAYEQGASFPGVIDQLVDKIEPAVAIASVRGTPVGLSTAVHTNVAYVSEKSELAGTVLSKAIAGDKLEVVGGVYDLATGKVTLVDDDDYDL